MLGTHIRRIQSSKTNTQTKTRHIASLEDFPITKNESHDFDRLGHFDRHRNDGILEAVEEPRHLGLHLRF